MDLSIFVPTKNRYYYLSKLLDYYSSINFTGELIILDSSNEIVQKKILKEISKKNEKIKIKYHHSIGLPCALMKKFIKSVETNYVLFSGDDDYFTSSGMKACLEFLNNNLSFIGCTGKGISVHSLISNKKINFILNYNQAKIHDNTSIDRISSLFKEYKVPIFSIYRTKQFEKFLDPVPSAENFEKVCPDKAIADEFIIEGAMAAYGKIEHLDCKYLVRHIHKDRNIGNMVPDFRSDWIISKNYTQSINYFFDEISKIISKEDNINKSFALEVLKKNYDQYLIRELKSEKKYLIKFVLSKLLSNFKFLREIRYYFIRNFFQKNIYQDSYNDNELKLIMNSIENKYE